MNTKQLRQKILDLAIHGKLVPQDPSDEPVSVLLEQVRMEKARLINKGKVKATTSVVSFNKSHYEDLPNGWEWAALSSLATFASGKTPSTDNPLFWNGGVNWVTSKDMKQKYIATTQIQISEQGAKQMQMFPPDTLLMVVRSGILKHTLPLALLTETATINQDIKAISFYIGELSNFVHIYFAALNDYILENYHKDGTTVDSINFEKFKDIAIPLPPLAEQHRIVAAVEAAFTIIDEIERHKADLLAAVTTAKQKILSLAIRGKLVPQNPNDKPIHVLTGLTEPSSIPYSLPKYWIWSKISESCEPQETKRPTGDSFRYIDIDSIDNKRHCVAEPKIVSTEQAPSRAAKGVLYGDVLFSMVRPYLENIAFVTEDLSDCIASTGFYVCRPKQKLLFPHYLYYFLISRHAVEGIDAYRRGDNSPAVRKDEMGNFLVPIPPLAEQHRIVVAIEAAFEQLDVIAKQIDEGGGKT